MAPDAHLNIDTVGPDGKPLLPRANAIKFVHQCGVVRDNVYISIREWNKPKGAEDARYYVSERLKGVLWDKLIAHFTLPVLEDKKKTDDMTAKVKHFALKKMAEQFNKWKNRLYNAYQKDKIVPLFEGTLELQREHWDAFLEYKESELAKQRSIKNKANAAKKKYFHNTVAGGYATAVPKWDAAEADIRKKGSP